MGRIAIDRSELLRVINNLLRARRVCAKCRVVAIVDDSERASGTNWMIQRFACTGNANDLAACEEAVRDFIAALQSRYIIVDRPVN